MPEGKEWIARHKEYRYRFCKCMICHRDTNLRFVCDDEVEAGLKAFDARTEEEFNGSFTWEPGPKEPSVIVKEITSVTAHSWSAEVTFGNRASLEALRNDV